jgi:hypothetical protein
MNSCREKACSRLETDELDKLVSSSIWLASRCNEVGARSLGVRPATFAPGEMNEAERK